MAAAEPGPEAEEVAEKTPVTRAVRAGNKIRTTVERA